MALTEDEIREAGLAVRVGLVGHSGPGQVDDVEGNETGLKCRKKIIQQLIGKMVSLNRPPNYCPVNTGVFEVQM